MKKQKFIFPVVLLLVILALPAFAQKKDIFGYYTIENAPKAFTDISEIHLAGEYGRQQKPVFYGLIRLKKKSAKDFQILKPVLNGKNITFSTNTVGGVSYKFSGAFTKLENFPETRPDGELVLSGKLIKYRGKTKLAEADVKFSYFAGD